MGRRLDRLIRSPESFFNPSLDFPLSRPKAWTERLTSIELEKCACSLGALPYRLLKTHEWSLMFGSLGIRTDRPDRHHFVLGLLACWCDDPLNLLARGDSTLHGRQKNI